MISVDRGKLVHNPNEAIRLKTKKQKTKKQQHSITLWLHHNSVPCLWSMHVYLCVCFLFCHSNELVSCDTPQCQLWSMKPFVIHSQATGKAKINKRNVDLKKKRIKKCRD